MGKGAALSNPLKGAALKNPAKGMGIPLESLRAISLCDMAVFV